MITPHWPQCFLFLTTLQYHVHYAQISHAVSTVQDSNSQQLVRKNEFQESTYVEGSSESLENECIC